MILFWFLFFTATSTQSQKFKVVRLKPSANSAFPANPPLVSKLLSSISHSSLPLIWLILWELSPFPSESLGLLSYAVFLLPLSDHCLSLLLRSEGTSIYPQVVWASVDGKCQEIEGKSFFFPKWFEDKVKSLSCFLATGWICTGWIISALSTLYLLSSL